MAEGENKENSTSKKLGLTGWFKVKFMGDDAEGSNPVDSKFIADLSDVTTVGRYEIIKKVGHGSMGMVYLGRDPYIDRDVGIKIARPAAGIEENKADNYRKRFFIEAQSAGRLVHPNIVSIYDAGMYKDFCYIAMEYIDGPTLSKYCNQEELLTVGKATEVMFFACKALGYAHKTGVIHRDIKPSNIMLTKSGYAKITDFGIAQIKSEQTDSKGIIGSPSYMAPEQVEEKAATNRSDIFSLGCVLYELLTGQKAFSGENLYSIMYKVAKEDPVPIRKIRPEVPEILEKIVAKALEKDPALRYQTCGDIAYDLRVALRGLRGAPKKDKIEDVIDYLNNVTFFESFTKNQINEILNASNILKVPGGNTVVTEGEIDDSFFIILSGEVSVEKNGKKIASISRGECFGEMSYLSGQTRTATITAETDCTLIKISASLMDRSAESIQLLFMKNFAIALSQRLSKGPT